MSGGGEISREKGKLVEVELDGISEDGVIDISQMTSNSRSKLQEQQKEYQGKRKERNIHNALGLGKYAVEKNVIFALTVGGGKSSYCKDASNDGKKVTTLEE